MKELKELDELEVEVAELIPALARFDAAYEAMRNGWQPKTVTMVDCGRFGSFPDNSHPDAKDDSVYWRGKTLEKRIESTIAETKAAYERKAVTDRDHEYDALKRLEAMGEALAARDASFIPYAELSCVDEKVPATTLPLLVQKLKKTGMADKDIASRIVQEHPTISDAKLGDLLPANPGATISYSARQSRGRRLRGKK